MLALGSKKSEQLSVNDSFPIVGDNDYVAVIHSLLDKRAQARPYTIVNLTLLFSVEPHHLLAMGDDARLTRRRSPLAGNYAGNPRANP